MARGRIDAFGAVVFLDDTDWVSGAVVRVGDGGKPVTGVRALRPTGSAPAAAEGVVRLADSAAIQGIPEAELTPRVREALMGLMREVERLRAELARTGARLGELEKLADTDVLLPVCNRRAFVREMSRLMSFAQRYKAPTSLVYFDVNGLKEINDTLGHAAGDKALEMVADALVVNVRESDVVGRLGGDEFGVLLAYAKEPVARAKAQQLAHAVAAKPFVWDGKARPLSVAFGVWEFQPGVDASAALAAADQEMYANKREGRPA